jgi:DNA-binding transcriptional regulator PaaX
MKTTTKQKVLLSLASGISLGFCRSPKQYFYILKQFKKDWENIDRGRLFRLVREFYKERLVDFKEKKDGTVRIILTEDGRKKALSYKIDEINIKKPAKWDKKWRIVIFDIPETKKRSREALRNKLRELGFQKMQKSVFVYPFECENEINFIMEFWGIRSYVKFLRAESITNESELKIAFNLY